MNKVELWKERLEEAIHNKYELDLLNIMNKKNINEEEMNLAIDKLNEKLERDLKDVTKKAYKKAGLEYFEEWW